MAEPKLEIERRLDRHEKALRRLAELTELDMYKREIEDILDGTETTSDKSADSAE